MYVKSSKTEKVYMDFLGRFWEIYSSFGKIWKNSDNSEKSRISSVNSEK